MPAITGLLTFLIGVVIAYQAPNSYESSEHIFIVDLCICCS
jgi:hypothetical protein